MALHPWHRGRLWAAGPGPPSPRRLEEGRSGASGCCECEQAAALGAGAGGNQRAGCRPRAPVILKHSDQAVRRLDRCPEPPRCVPSPFTGTRAQGGPAPAPRSLSTQRGSPSGGIWRLGLAAGPLHGPPETHTHTSRRLPGREADARAAGGGGSRPRQVSAAREQEARRPRGRAPSGGRCAQRPGAWCPRVRSRAGATATGDPCSRGRRDLAPCVFPADRRPAFCKISAIQRDTELVQRGRSALPPPDRAGRKWGPLSQRPRGPTRPGRMEGAVGGTAEAPPLFVRGRRPARGGLAGPGTPSPGGHAPIRDQTQGLPGPSTCAGGGQGSGDTGAG